MVTIYSLIYLFICFEMIINTSDFPYEPSPASIVPLDCKTNCKTPYGSILGEHNGVKSYSNCNDKRCSNDEDSGSYLSKSNTGLIEDVYTGVRWQCVEYARRWLIANKQVSFESIPAAFDIFDIKTVKNLKKEKSSFPFESYTNGNQIPPTLGDLIIFPETPDSPFGHVAVITQVNLEEGYVGIAEQNINKIWEDQSSYSRRLVIVKKDEKYFLTDVPWKKKNKLFDDNFEDHFKHVIGWKRVVQS